MTLPNCTKFIYHRDAFCPKSALRLVVSVVVCVMLMSGCSVLAPPGTVESDPPAQWCDRLPAASLIIDTGLSHNARLTGLSKWWSQQNDRLLMQMLDAAQRVSPSTASALVNIAQTQVTCTAAGASMLPMAERIGNHGCRHFRPDADMHPQPARGLHASAHQPHQPRALLRAGLSRISLT